jgi:ribosomal protein L37AE/L43A
MSNSKDPDERPTCPNCPIHLQVERDDGHVVWWGCPKCGHIEARDPPPPTQDPPAPRPM